MKFKASMLLIASISLLLFLTACTNDAQITNYEECVAAGYPVMESYPEKCSDGNQTFTRVIDDIIPKPCTKEYMPVCASLQVQCIRAPCPPINTTFANKCLAENENAKILYEGACEDTAPNPEGACLSFDGNWVEETKECEGMSQTQCEELHGTFNECASACRNDPDAMFCTQQCVIVCDFQ